MTSTSPVAAVHLAAGAFSSVKMTTLDFTSLVLLTILPQAHFFLPKWPPGIFTSNVAAIHRAAGALFSTTLAALDFTSPGVCFNAKVDSRP